MGVTSPSLECHLLSLSQNRTMKFLFAAAQQICKNSIVINNKIFKTQTNNNSAKAKIMPQLDVIPSLFGHCSI